MRSGGQFVMTGLPLRMPQWLAGSSDSMIKVHKLFHSEDIFAEITEYTSIKFS